MNYQIICGNLGADAELKNEQGHEFVKFNVADTRKWKSEDGTEHEETVWVSCIMNGKQEGLMKYLKRGQKVLVMGQSSVRVYSSEKFRRMVAGINLRVDRLELVGAVPELVPRRLVTSDGTYVDTFKAYFIRLEDLKAYNIQTAESFYISDERGAQYVVNQNGQVFPSGQVPNVAKTDDNNNSQDEQP